MSKKPSVSDPVGAIIKETGGIRIEHHVAIGEGDLRIMAERCYNAGWEAALAEVIERTAFLVHDTRVLLKERLRELKDPYRHE